MHVRVAARDRLQGLSFRVRLCALMLRPSLWHGDELKEQTAGTPVAESTFLGPVVTGWALEVRELSTGLPEAVSVGRFLAWLRRSR